MVTWFTHLGETNQTIFIAVCFGIGLILSSRLNNHKRSTFAILLAIMVICYLFMH